MDLATNIFLFLLWKRFRESGTKFNLFVSVKVLRISLTLIGIPILLSVFLNPGSEFKSKTSEVVIIQPNIDPYEEKYNTNNDSIASLIQNLADQSISNNTDLIIAPETVLARSIELLSIPYDRSITSLSTYIQDASQNFLPRWNFNVGPF